MNFKDVKKWSIGGKEVKTLTIGGTIYWQKEEPKPTAFYILNEDTKNINIKMEKQTRGPYTAYNIKLSYTKDGINWNEWTNLYKESIVLKPKEIVYFKGDNPSGFANYNVISSTSVYIASNDFIIDGIFSIGGNIFSLIDSTETKTDFSKCNGCFNDLFYGSRYKMLHSKDLVFSAEKIGDYGFKNLFYNQSILKDTPLELPFKAIGQRTYESMFYGCNEIETSPIIRVERIGRGGCNYMFKNCQKLKKMVCYTTSDLSITDSGYYEKPYYYTDRWLEGTQAKGTFYKNKNATWNLTNSSGTNGWDIVLVDPETDK